MSMFRDLKGELLSLKNKQDKSPEDISRIQELERLLVSLELDMYSKF